MQMYPYQDCKKYDTNLFLVNINSQGLGISHRHAHAHKHTSTQQTWVLPPLSHTSKNPWFQQRFKKERRFHQGSERVLHSFYSKKAVGKAPLLHEIVWIIPQDVNNYVFMLTSYIDFHGQFYLWYSIDVCMLPNRNPVKTMSCFCHLNVVTDVIVLKMAPSYS